MIKPTMSMTIVDTQNRDASETGIFVGTKVKIVIKVTDDKGEIHGIIADR